MGSKEIARERILHLVDLVYDSYKDFEDELGFKRNTVTEWKRGVSTFMDKLPEIADALGTSTDYLLGRENASLVPEITYVPLVGRIQAGYPVESFASPKKYIKVPIEIAQNDDDYFALTVVGDSMMPLVMEGDVIILHKNTDQYNNEICAVTVDGESTLKRVRIDSAGVTLIPTNPIYKEIHFSPRKAEEKNLHVDGVLVQMIRNF